MVTTLESSALLSSEKINILCYLCYCSARSRNRDNSRIVLDKEEILTLLGEVGIPTWLGSIPELSLRKVGIGTKWESIGFTVQSRNRE